METVTLNPGDSITKGQKVAVLSDDTRLRLEQYTATPMRATCRWDRR